MLMWLTLVAGSAMIVGGVLVMARVDQRWRRAHLQCCRCLEVWFSRAKLCERCGARGRGYDWRARKFAGFPTHDWQGFLDTGPIPRVETLPRGVTPSAAFPRVTTLVSMPTPRPVPTPSPSMSTAGGAPPAPGAEPPRS